MPTSLTAFGKSIKVLLTSGVATWLSQGGRIGFGRFLFFGLWLRLIYRGLAALARTGRCSLLRQLLGVWAIDDEQLQGCQCRGGIEINPAENERNLP